MVTKLGKSSPKSFLSNQTNQHLMRYHLDIHGTHWYWSCGWKTLENDQVCLPHSTFRRSIKICAITEVVKPKSRHVLRNRPYETWRRHFTDKLYDHFLYGEVQLLATDGIHAIVLAYCHDTPQRVEVHLSNLYEIKPYNTEGTKTGRAPSYPADLKPFVATARAICKEQGIDKPTEDQVTKVAEQIQLQTKDLFV